MALDGQKEKTVGNKLKEYLDRVTIVFKDIRTDAKIEEQLVTNSKIIFVNLDQ